MFSFTWSSLGWPELSTETAKNHKKNMSVFNVGGEFHFQKRFIKYSGSLYPWSLQNKQRKTLDD